MTTISAHKRFSVNVIDLVNMQHAQITMFKNVPCEILKHDYPGLITSLE